MNRQGCLEDFESEQYHERELIDWFANGFVCAVRSSGLDPLNARFFQISLMNCGFSFFEALYLICGPEIQNCTLLSRKTQELARRIVEAELKEWYREPGDILDNKINKFVKGLDEYIFREALRNDSKRLDNALNRLKERVG